MEYKPTDDSKQSPGLIRGLGLWAAIGLVIGAMIGQSVFLVASDMARELGSSTRVLAVWLLGGVVVLFGSCCYAELGAAMPEAGGEYIYLSRGLGPAWGFLYGWLTAIALIRLRVKQPDLLRPYRTWGYPWTPVIFGISALATSANLILVRPVRSSIGMVIILLGIPFFHYWSKRSGRMGC